PGRDRGRGDGLPRDLQRRHQRPGEGQPDRPEHGQGVRHEPPGADFLPGKPLRRLPDRRVLQRRRAGIQRADLARDRPGGAAHPRGGAGAVRGRIPPGKRLSRAGTWGRLVSARPTQRSAPMALLTQPALNPRHEIFRIERILLPESDRVAKREHKIIAVLPAYNAERTLAATLADVPVGALDEVVLVDDGSTDRTVQVAREMGLTVIVHPENRGYGG